MLIDSESAFFGSPSTAIVLDIFVILNSKKKAPGICAFHESYVLYMVVVIVTMVMACTVQVLINFSFLCNFEQFKKAPSIFEFHESYVL